MTETWPVVAPNLEQAIDEILAATRNLPHIGKVIAQHKDLIKTLEVAHFEALLGGRLDTHYAESCRNTVEQEAAIGLDARMRSTAGSFVLKAALDALARKHRFSAARLAERGKRWQGGAWSRSLQARLGTIAAAAKPSDPVARRRRPITTRVQSARWPSTAPAARFRSWRRASRARNDEEKG